MAARKEPSATPPPPKKPRKKQVKYSLELGAQVCRELAKSPRSIELICRENENFPHFSTVYDWLIDHPEFCEMYDKAKEKQQDILIDDICTRSQHAPDDYYYFDREGNRRIDAGRVALFRIEVDAKKWQAARLARNKWGDKHDISITADDKAREIYEDVKKRTKKHDREF